MATKYRTTSRSIAQPAPGHSGRRLERVALYARVSTANNQDPEMQLRELREYAELRGWTITEEYVDIGVSGSREFRPSLNKLIGDARRRVFDVILVWKLDRFGRSLKHLVTLLPNFVDEIEHDRSAERKAAHAQRYPRVPFVKDGCEEI